MTTWYPISGTVPQYEDGNGKPYSGAVLKAYQAGTSTNIPLATDSTGGTAATSMALNAAGYPVVSGTTIIPHVDRAYKLVLYPTQAAADSNTGAIWTQDNISISAPLNNPGLTGIPTAPTAIVGTDTTQIATCEFANNAADAAAASAISSVIKSSVNNFRLTLTSGKPVTTLSVTAATTIYCSPYKGNQIALYDGAVWNIRSSNEFSLGIGVLTSGLPYDVFCYDNDDVPTLEFCAWTNDTTRATDLALQDGVYVKSGDATRRYLGTFYTTSQTTTEDSISKRYIWNYYNRVERLLRVVDVVGSWTYSTNTWRQANALTTNQAEFVIGVSEDFVNCNLRYGVLNSTSTLRTVGIGIGLDAISPVSIGYRLLQVGSTAMYGNIISKIYVSEGRHYLPWLEKGDGTDTQTWYAGAADIYGLLCSVNG